MKCRRRLARCMLVVLLGSVGYGVLSPGEPPLGSSNTGAVDLIAYDSAVGQRLLAQSTHRQDFAKLSRYFITQNNVGFCSVASSVMALNALEIDKPVVPGYEGHRLFTQENFFTDAVRRQLSPGHVRRHGMNLYEVSRAIETFGVRARVQEGDALSVDDLRASIEATLTDPDAILLSEYHRRALGQSGVGHFSPIAAYDAQTDRVLILDVSRYKYPPVWVPTEVLAQALRGGDSEGNPLGLVVVSRRTRRA